MVNISENEFQRRLDAEYARGLSECNQKWILRIILGLFGVGTALLVAAGEVWMGK